MSPPRLPIKNVLNLVNPITNKSVDLYTKLCKRGLILFLSIQLETLGAYKDVILNQQA